MRGRSGWNFQITYLLNTHLLWYTAQTPSSSGFSLFASDARFNCLKKMFTIDNYDSTFCLLVCSADSCKEFEPISGPTKRWPDLDLNYLTLLLYSWIPERIFRNIWKTKTKKACKITKHAKSKWVRKIGSFSGCKCALISYYFLFLSEEKISTKAERPLTQPITNRWHLAKMCLHVSGHLRGITENVP